MPGSPTQKALSATGHQAALGLVGAGATGEWVSWLRDLDLPEPEDVIAGRADLPKRGDRLAATLSAVATAAAAERPDRVDRCKTVIEIMKGVRPDVGLPAASQLLRALPSEVKEKLDGISDLHDRLQEVRS
jgi:hypothetical protein